MNNATFWRTLLIGASLLALRCSSGGGPVAGGGSDLPNGATARLYGNVLLPDFSIADSITVIAKKIIVTVSGDSIVVQKTVLTDNAGNFLIDSLDSGTYVVFFHTVDNRFSCVNQHINVVDHSDTLAPVMLLKNVDIVGHVILPSVASSSNLVAFIPGTNTHASINPTTRDLIFVLNKVPQGPFVLAISFNGIINYLSLKIHADTFTNEPLYLRTIEFAVMNIMADSNKPLFTTNVQNAFGVLPKDYPIGTEPSWYHTQAIDSINYYNHRSGDTAMWHPDPGRQMPYDTLLTGKIFRTPQGLLELEVSLGQTYLLSGGPTAMIGGNKQCVVIAAFYAMAGLPFDFEIVDMLLLDADCCSLGTLQKSKITSGP